MPLAAAALLGRLARTLRDEVGPAVGDPFAKTQAFMASVILTKLAGELRSRERDAEAEDADRRRVVETLRGALDASAPTQVRDAVEALAGDGGDGSWNRLVTAIYADRDQLGSAKADRLLAEVRVALRARLDRALVYSA